MDYSFFLFIKLFDQYLPPMDVLIVPYSEQYIIYQKVYKFYNTSRYNTAIWYGQWRWEYDCMIDFFEECSRPFVIQMDGKIMKFLNSHDECFWYILENQSQSVDYATKHWGWEILEIKSIS